MLFLRRTDRSRRRLRPAFAGTEPLSMLEPRVVPTVIYGPYYNPQDGLTTVLTEVNGTVEAQLSLSSNASAVKVAYASFSNATPNSTATGGDHNEGNQKLQGLELLVLLPGESAILELDEGPEGTWSDGQPTGTQFDVSVDPVSDLFGNETVNVAGEIAYKNPS